MTTLHDIITDVLYDAIQDEKITILEGTTSDIADDLIMNITAYLSR